MNLLSILIIFLLPHYQSLQNDSILIEHFTPQEIVQLDSIRTFFNHQILANCQKSNDISVCYRQYFDRLSDPGNFNFEVPYEEQLALYQTLDSSLFNSIWRYTPTPVYSASVDSSVIHNTIDYNMKGSYMNFLKDVAKQEPYFDKYLDPMRASGTLSPSLAKGFQYNPSGLDFYEARHQLILAIHFLTFNDQRVNSPK